MYRTPLSQRNVLYFNFYHRYNSHPSFNENDNQQSEKQFIDHYQTLKILPNATNKDIRLSFWKLYFFHQLFTHDGYVKPWLTSKQQTKAFYLLRFVS